MSTTTLRKKLTNFIHITSCDYHTYFVLVFFIRTSKLTGLSLEDLLSLRRGQHVRQLVALERLRDYLQPNKSIT